MTTRSRVSGAVHELGTLNQTRERRALQAVRRQEQIVLEARQTRDRLRNELAGIRQAIAQLDAQRHGADASVNAEMFRAHADMRQCWLEDLATAQHRFDEGDSALRAEESTLADCRRIRQRVQRKLDALRQVGQNLQREARRAGEMREQRANDDRVRPRTGHHV